MIKDKSFFFNFLSARHDSRSDSAVSDSAQSAELSVLHMSDPTINMICIHHYITNESWRRECQVKCMIN